MPDTMTWALLARYLDEQTDDRIFCDIHQMIFIPITFIQWIVQNNLTFMLCK